MKGIKVLIEGAAVLCMTALLTITAITGSDKAAREQGNKGLENIGIAGVASVLNDYKLALAEESTFQVSIVDQNIDVVGAALDTASVQENTEADNTEQETAVAEEAQKEAASETKEVQSEKNPEPELTEEEKEWQQYLMPDVKVSLNIRAEASEDSEVVGRLYKGDRALIKEAGSEWTKIASGNAVGYVKNEYCVFGLDALNYAKKNCGVIATVTGKSLRIRKGQSTQSGIVKSVPEGEVLTVNKDAETEDGWVAVVIDAQTYYVSADYVELSYNTGKAKTIEEEKAEEEEKEKESKAVTTTKTQKVQGDAVSASTDELTLLAAIIQCEAGGQSYECQLAVGAVVLNRVASSRYPNSIEGVIYQKHQFGPVSNGSLNRRLRNGVSQTAYNAAEEALSGVDNTNGCLYFNVASCGHSGLQIGAVVFWK